MEEWKEIDGYPGYEVSNRGDVRTYWERRRCPTGYGTYKARIENPRPVPQSDDGNGYMKVFLRNPGSKGVCKKVHRLVAEAFIPNPYGPNYTVDHIRSGPEGKLDNSVGNLEWVSRPDNIRKAYRDGMCDERIRNQNKAIVALDLWTGEEKFFHSIGDAATMLNIDRASISHVLRGDYEKTSHYTFEYAGREEKLLYGNEDHCN